MYNDVYFSGIARRPVTQNQNNNYAETPITRPQYKQFNEISPAVSNAIYSYTSPIISKPYEKMSLNDNLLRLKKEGKREGIDYQVEGFKAGNIVLYINNKSGQPLKVLHYDGGDVERVNCYETYQYHSGREVRRHSFDRNNKLIHEISTYYNDDVPQEYFTDAHITYKTSPNEYIEYLKSKNAKYKIEKDTETDHKRIKITEIGDKNNKKSAFIFVKYNDGYTETNLEEFNEYEELVKDTTFTPNTTRIDLFFEKIKTKFIPQNVLKQEDLTKEHINAYTKPEDYILYLEQNGVRYKIDNINSEENKIVKISEYDDYNHEYQFTCFEMNRNPIVLRQINDQNDNKIRYEFQPEGTYMTTYRY